MSFPRAQPVALWHRDRIRDALGVVLALAVVLSAIPLGSNHPVFWLGNAVVLGVIGAVYFGLRPDSGQRPGRVIMRVWPIALCFAGMPLAGLLQLLPFPGSVAGIETRTITIDQLATLLGVVRLLSYGVFMVLLAEVARDPARIRRMLWIVFGGVFLHAVFALVELGIPSFFDHDSAYPGMATGTFVNRNSFASFLGMGFVVGLTLLRVPAGAEGRVRSAPLGPAAFNGAARWFALGLIGLALLATQSRMGLAATAAGAVAVMAATPGVGPLRTVRWRNAAFALGAIVVMGVFGQGVILRGLMAGPALVDRVTLFGQVIAMIGERPLAGFGLDSFRAAFELYHQPPLATDLTWNYAHNVYLALWAEMGVIAGSLPLVAGLLIAMTIVKRLKTGATEPAIAAAFGVLVLQAVHSLADFSLEISANVLLFVFVLVLGLVRAVLEEAK